MYEEEGSEFAHSRGYDSTCPVSVVSVVVVGREGAYEEERKIFAHSGGYGSGGGAGDRRGASRLLSSPVVNKFGYCYAGVLVDRGGV